MTVVSRILNSFVFWGAWIIIPVLMEILPALGSLFLLAARRRKVHKKGEITYFPEISILVPVYNSQDTLFRCIESINGSTYPNDAIRIFLVNNQGTDDSFSVFARCQELFPDLRMQWLSTEQGKSRALNAALYNSQGKYIINIDSDGQLEEHALYNVIRKFEADEELNCITGAILTDPDRINDTDSLFLRLVRQMEFVEYAQAFLAGRSYASETNSVYTLSGAFSAFRKSAILDSWMYNTETVSEDTHITFQMRYLKGQRIEVCEDALFLVDPIEGWNKLYTQRQRWQRGSLEVAHMFTARNLKFRKALTDVNVRTLLFDHTFAFPRMIWYLAMICLQAMRYSPTVIFYSVLIIFALYILVAYFYAFSAAWFLRINRKLQSYYHRHFWCVALLPLHNFCLFFVRFAGIINSISTDSTWKTRNLSEEWGAFTGALREEVRKPLAIREKIYRIFNNAEETGDSGEASYGPVDGYHQ